MHARHLDSPCVEPLENRYLNDLVTLHLESRVANMPWVYEPDPERKHKTGWTKNVAGFVTVANTLVSKCPHNLTNETCEELINSGVEYSPPKRWNRSYPDRIYNIIDCVVYRATPTIPGSSYHGFPELPDRVAKLPRELRNRILDLAEERGCREEVEKWMKG